MLGKRVRENPKKLYLILNTDMLDSYYFKIQILDEVMFSQPTLLNTTRNSLGSIKSDHGGA